MTNQHHETTCNIHSAQCEWTIKSFDFFHGSLSGPSFFAPTANDIKFCVALQENISSEKTSFTKDKSKFNVSFSISSKREFTSIYATISCSIMESGLVLRHILQNRSALFKKPDQLSLVWNNLLNPTLNSNILNLLFTINFNIDKYCETTSFSFPLKKENSLSINKLINDLNCLNSDPSWADIIILVEGKEFPAHKVILSARSPIFKNKLSTISSSNTSGIIHINIDNTKARTWKVLQHFIYTGQLDLTIDCKSNAIVAELTLNCAENRENCENKDSGLNENIDQDQSCELDIFELVALADEYGLQTAVNELEFKMTEMLNDENLLDYLRCATKHKLMKLEKICFKRFRWYDVEKKRELFSSSKWKEMGSQNPEILMKCLESSVIQ